MQTHTTVYPSWDLATIGDKANRPAHGFTLIETLIALVIMAFGLLAAGQLIYIAEASASLSRSKGSAAVVAQDKVEYLSELYSRDPSTADLTDGNHGPEQVQIISPATNHILNRYSVSWIVTTVPDPRAGKVLKAKMVVVTVTPVDSNAIRNYQAFLNKIVTVTAICGGSAP
jgi:prepilin-type N-terminal cleavage/methylation domain-containing protein